MVSKTRAVISFEVSASRDHRMSVTRLTPNWGGGASCRRQRQQRNSHATLPVEPARPKIGQRPSSPATAKFEQEAPLLHQKEDYSLMLVELG